MKTNKILYYVATAIVSMIFLFSAFMYFTKYEMITGFFESFQFPTWLVYPLAIAKIIGVITLWVRPHRTLVEWAYAGFFFNAVLATVAHVNAGQGFMQLSVLAIVAVLLSRFFYGKVFKQTETN